MSAIAFVMSEYSFVMSAIAIAAFEYSFVTSENSKAVSAIAIATFEYSFVNICLSFLANILPKATILSKYPNQVFRQNRVCPNCRFGHI